MRVSLVVIVLGCLAVARVPAQQPTRAFFQTSLTLDEMSGKQAVVDTTMGAFVIQFRPDKAPNHVGHFMTLAREGEFAGRTFHRVIRYGIIQGGDPISTDPARASEYGTGGLQKLRAEFNDLHHTAGAVSAVLVPGDPDSAGDQFFICASDQPALDGQYTVFGEVVEGLEVVQAISAVDTSAEGVPAERVEIRSVTLRDTPPPEAVPFATDTPEELAAFRAVLETTMGEIELSFMPDVAPEHVRNFLRLAESGVYDDMLVHRVAKDFVIQTGALGYRQSPLTQVQQRYVTTLPPEFSDTPTLPGIVAMARDEDPASASTSFFICVGECRSLDNTYTAFARVSAGMDVVRAIEAVEVDGETPRTPILVRRARVIR